MSRRPRYYVEVAADHPDAVLIALCNTAVADHARGSLKMSRAMAMADRGGAEAVMAEVCGFPSSWHKLTRQIRRTPATTPEGIRAKAEVLAAVAALDSPDIASLVSDIIGRRVGDMTARVLISTRN